MAPALIHQHATESGDGPQGSLRQLICFRVADEEYAIDIGPIREIRAWSEPRPLPNSPVFLRGVINLRGEIVPIFDIRARFGMAPTQVTRRHVVMVVAAGGRAYGLLVDAVSDIISVPTSDIATLPETGRRIDDAYLDGLAVLGERMTAIVAIERLLSPEALAGAERGLRLLAAEARSEQLPPEAP